MRAYIPLAHGLSATSWRERYALGDVPDASPYGLHKLAEHDVEVTFGETEFGRVSERVARSVRHRTYGAEMLEGLYESAARHRRRADVVLAYDERTGIPAELFRTSRHAPIALGVGWLTTRSVTPRIHAALAARALPRAAAVWANCLPLLPVLGREWGVPSARLHFIPLGIDADFYHVHPAPRVADVIVSAGEDRYRDHSLLIAAVKSLSKRRPDIRLELATELPVVLPREFGILHCARLNGKMRDLYRRASVVAIALKPTLSGSGLTVALEAMASGRPVVMTDNPGVSDYVEHGVTGLLVPPNDVEAFAAAIGKLLDDPQLAAAMGVAGSARVRQSFTSGVMVSELAKLMKAI
jgi:glycosyltransferase involved in cell wall biosynthesis